MAETQAVVPPDAEKLLTALDHLDAAYDLAAGVYAPISDHIHLAREEAKRHAGHLIYEASVRARQSARIDGGGGGADA